MVASSGVTARKCMSFRRESAAVIDGGFAMRRAMRLHVCLVCHHPLLSRIQCRYVHTSLPASLWPMHCMLLLISTVLCCVYASHRLPNAVPNAAVPSAVVPSAVAPNAVVQNGGMVFYPPLLNITDAYSPQACAPTPTLMCHCTGGSTDFPSVCGHGFRSM